MEMRCRISLVKILIMGLIVPSVAFCQAKPDTLKAITSRGQALAEYDAQCWIASDAVMASKPDNSLVERYIARRIGEDWEVAFGKFNDKKDAFVVNYKYSKNPDLVKNPQTPYEDNGYYFQSAKAIEGALQEFNKTNTIKRPFNTAVLPEGDNYYVYVYPAQLKEGIYPLGGDWRYLVSGKTFEILETRRLHKTIIESDTPMPKNVESGYHVAVLDDQPEDTDVYNVLTRKPNVPEMVATRNYVYRINKDGQIEYLGLVKEVLGKKNISVKNISVRSPESHM